MNIKKTALIVFFVLVGISSVIAFLFYNGSILFNNPSIEDYPIRGVDVSSYQGEIDWKVIAYQNISFAFIKATEGSTLVDKYFAKNYREAIESGIRVGAYHFFSFDSAGDTQADNFIANVAAYDNMLPPVVDVELYGVHKKSPPDKENTVRELGIFLDMLEDNYGLRPIIYATEKTYDLYIAGNFCDHDIWIRNVITAPTLSDNRSWKFWQYSNRGKLKGYKGQEKYIDLNVFCGSKDEFEQYGRRSLSGAR
jgi:lysozyme